MTVKAILFDLDGTLIDTAPDFFAVVNSLRAEQGKSPLADERIREQVSNGGSALTRLTFDYPADAGRDLATASAEFIERRQRLLDLYLEHIGSKSGYFSGFEQTLSEFDKRDIAWGIVTNKPRVYTDALLNKLDIHCDIVICPDELNKAKPDPEGLLKAAKSLELMPEQCWYVGDHIRDIEAAKAANMPSIAVRFGYIEADDSADNWGADKIIDQPQDLITLIDAQN